MHLDICFVLKFVEWRIQNQVGPFESIDMRIVIFRKSFGREYGWHDSKRGTDAWLQWLERRLAGCVHALWWCDAQPGWCGQITVTVGGSVCECYDWWEDSHNMESNACSRSCHCQNIRASCQRWQKHFNLFLISFKKLVNVTRLCMSNLRLWIVHFNPLFYRKIITRLYTPNTHLRSGLC